MKKKKSFQIIYQVDAEELEKVVSLAVEIACETGMEPKTLVLPDGRELPWKKGGAAHQFVAIGRISEKEFIEWSLTKE